MTVTLERFVQEGMKDGSIVNCDPQLVVQLLLGMLIWLARWTSDINGLTPDKLMDAIETFSFRGLARSCKGWGRLPAARSAKSAVRSRPPPP